MVMSFKYKSITRANGVIIKTPSIPITILGNSGLRIEFTALIDSGADVSVIPQEVAELLNINIQGEKSKSKGIGGEVDVVNSKITLNIRKGHEDYTFTIPVQIVLGNHQIPVLLGRTGFFDEFSILFEQSKEKILLKKINKGLY